MIGHAGGEPSKAAEVIVISSAMQARQPELDASAGAGNACGCGAPRMLAEGWSACARTSAVAGTTAKTDGRRRPCTMARCPAGIDPTVRQRGSPHALRLERAGGRASGWSVEATRATAVQSGCPDRGIVTNIIAETYGNIGGRSKRLRQGFLRKFVSKHSLLRARLFSCTDPSLGRGPCRKGSPPTAALTTFGFHAQWPNVGRRTCASYAEGCGAISTSRSAPRARVIEAAPCRCRRSNVVERALRPVARGPASRQNESARYETATCGLRGRQPPLHKVGEVGGVT